MVLVMKLEGDYLFAARIQEVWDALFDPQVLAAVLPGCEKLELVDGAYVGEIKVKVGPIQGKFSGKVDLLDLVEPTSYRMVIDGRGQQGFVKATATIKLETEGESTRIRYDADAQVGGKIASVGQRLVETSAKAVVKESLQGLSENIEIRTKAFREQATAASAAAAPPPPAAAPAPPVVPADESTAESESAAGTESAAGSESAPEPAPEPAPAPVVAAPPKPAPAPAIEYKRADPKKLAGAVAKEVGKTLAPIIVLVVGVLAVIIYLLVR